MEGIRMEEIYDRLNYAEYRTSSFQAESSWKIIQEIRFCSKWGNGVSLQNDKTETNESSFYDGIQISGR